MQRLRGGADSEGRHDGGRKRTGRRGHQVARRVSRQPIDLPTTDFPAGNLRTVVPSGTPPPSPMSGAPPVGHQGGGRRQGLHEGIHGERGYPKSVCPLCAGRSVDNT